MLLAAYIFAVLEALAAANAPNPLAMAETGKVQCYRPNVQNKTCQSIASYQRTGPGAYDNKAIVPVSADITLETHTPVVIKADAVCGFVRGQDAIAGTLRMKGDVVDSERAKPILEGIAQSVASLSNQEICTRYEPTGTDFIAKISVGGTYQADLDETVRWIGPGDGYSVAP